MSKFRISISSASCKEIENIGFFEKKVCEGVYKRINEIKNVTFANLMKRLDEDTDFENIQNKEVVYTIYKEVMDEAKLLFIVQAMYKTFQFPNYFSVGFIGKIVVEGIIITSTGEAINPSDKLLYKYK